MAGYIVRNLPIRSRLNQSGLTNPGKRSATSATEETYTALTSEEQNYVLSVFNTLPVSARTLLGAGEAVFGCRGYNAGTPTNFIDLIMNFTVNTGWVAIMESIEVTMFAVPPAYIDDPALIEAVAPEPAAPASDNGTYGYVNNDGTNGQIINAFELAFYQGQNKTNPDGPILYGPQIIENGLKASTFVQVLGTKAGTEVGARLRPLRLTRYESWVAQWQIKGVLLPRKKGDLQVQQANNDPVPVTQAYKVAS